MFPSKGDVLHIPYGSYRPRQRETSYTSKLIKMIRCPTTNPQRTYKFGNNNSYLKDRTNRQPTSSPIISKYCLSIWHFSSTSNRCIVFINCKLSTKHLWTLTKIQTLVTWSKWWRQHYIWWRHHSTTIFLSCFQIFPLLQVDCFFKSNDLNLY